jgi:hypothetical protein
MICVVDGGSAQTRSRAMKPLDRPPPPPDLGTSLLQPLRRLQQQCYKLTSEAGYENTEASSLFDNFVMLCIIVNTLGMSCRLVRLLLFLLGLYSHCIGIVIVLLLLV